MAKLLQPYLKSGLGIINTQKVTRPLIMTRQSNQFPRLGVIPPHKPLWLLALYLTHQENNLWNL